MFLTVFVFIFIFRMRYPVIEFFEVTKKQTYFLNFLFFVSCFSFFGIVFVFKLQKYQFLTPLLPFSLELLLLKVFERRNSAFLLQDLENLLSKLSLDLKNSKSFYSSIKNYCEDIESFRQQNYRNMILSVLFAQQKPPKLKKSKEFSEFLVLIPLIQESRYASSNILETFRSNFLFRKQILGKKYAITQNIRVQTFICCILFLFLMIFQFNALDFNELLSFLIISVTFFVIGLLGLYFFMRYYV